MKKISLKERNKILLERMKKVFSMNGNFLVLDTATATVNSMVNLRKVSKDVHFIAIKRKLLQKFAKDLEVDNSIIENLAEVSSSCLVFGFFNTKLDFIEVVRKEASLFPSSVKIIGISIDRKLFLPYDLLSPLLPFKNRSGLLISLASMLKSSVFIMAKSIEMLVAKRAA